MMQHNSSSKKSYMKTYWNVIIFSSAMFIFIFCIMYKAPWLWDDFEFMNHRYESLKEIIKHSLYYGNGRLLGNIGVFYLLEFPIIGALMKAFVFSGIVILIPNILGIKKVQGWYITALLFFGMNPAIFAQIGTWTSGFQNYVPPILFLLVCICILQNDTVASKRKLIVLAILAFCSQLYIEHCSVINVLIALLFYVYYTKNQLIEKKKCAFVLTCSFMLGIIVMFLIPKVFYIENNRAEGYRGVHLENLADIITTVKECIILSMTTYSQCILLWIFFGILGVNLLKITKTNWKNRLIYKMIKGICVLYPILVTLFYCVRFYNSSIISIGRYVFVYCGMVIFLIAMLIIVLHITNENIKILIKVKGYINL